MNSQRVVFKWLASIIGFAILLQSALFLSPVSAEQMDPRACNWIDFAFEGQEEVVCKLMPVGATSSQLNKEEASRSEASSALENLINTPTVPWILQVGAEGTEIYDVTTDTSGNVYVTGAVYSASDSDAFVKKLDSDGNTQWSYSFGGMTYDAGYGIIVDSYGSIYITGTTQTYFNVNGDYIHDILIAKLSGDGVLQWTKTYGSVTQPDYGFDISLDGTGSVYVTGGSWSSWGSPIRSHTLGQYDAFVAKFDPNTGNYIWHTFLAENLNSIGSGIASDTNGNVYVTGNSFIPGSTHDAFIAGLNTNGNVLWFTTAGDAGTNESGRDIALDGSGNIYVAGQGLGSTMATMDAFVLKLSNSGSLQWSTLVGGIGFDLAYGIAVDVLGNIYIAGPSTNIWGNPFDSGTGSPQEVFVAKLDNNGSVVWNTFIKGEAWYYSSNHPNSIATHNGSLYIASHTTNVNSSLAFITQINDQYGCSVTPDTFEPDDTSETGSPITFGETQRHTLCPQNDQDWVSFQTTDLQPDLLVETFDLEPDSINPNGDTQLTVKDSSQIQIGTNQDRGLAPPSGSIQPDVQSSRVAWHPATEGLFNINIFPETPINEQAGTGYSLHLANPFMLFHPVDQASWAPTKVNVPTVWRSGGNVIYFSQQFVFEQAELDALINLNTTLAWEFRRPGVNPSTGVETDSNVDFGDYFQNVDGECVGDYWTNLPSHTDDWSEETNLLCPYQELLGNEEFEVFIDDPTQLIAGKVYYVVVKFYVHSEYLNSTYQFYISKAEHCIKDPQFWGVALDPIFCNIVEEGKSSANLIEGYLQPAP
jgi:hypothetical protein